MKKLLLVAILTSSFISAYAQTTDSGELVAVINTIGDNQPDSGTNVYVPATSGELATWSSVISNLLSANYTQAADSAATISYDLIQFTDTSESPDGIYYMLKSNGTNYWGTYVYNPSHTRAVIIQSPHPNYDFNTDKEGAYVFKKSGAAFFMMSGTHRCNNPNFSACAGTTGVCNAGVDVSFQVSDMAHVEETPFHITTDTLFTRFSNSYFIQLHGFTKTGSDPYVIMSNGTADTPSTDYLVDLKNNLFIEDNTLTFKLAHIDSGWTRLVGFTNTQGRLINGSVTPCSQSASTSSGRFLHLEQEKTKLRSNETGWIKMANAITNTFPLSALPVELVYFNVALNTNRTATIKWQTASETNNHLFTIERSADGETWETIANKQGAINSANSIYYTVTDTKPLPGYSYYRLKQTDLDGKYTYSPTRVLFFKPEITLYPNPAGNQLYIETPHGEGISKISVVNSQGVSYALNYHYKEGKLIIDSSVLAAGIYIVNLYSPSGIIRSKLIIEK